ncbi:MAG: DUF3800 domain-containing protein [Bacteroidota bacterium]
MDAQAGVAIQDSDLWKFIKDAQKIELNCFGRRYRVDGREIKAKKFLNRKTFRLAEQLGPIDLFQRSIWAREALENGEDVTREQLTALAQAKLFYVKQLLQLCHEYRCKVFACIVTDPKKINSDSQLLRRDYVYLFERFYYFLEDKFFESRGIVVFDELDKSTSHILLSQMDKYFKNTIKGRARSNLVIPEPFFVHSDLTTGIQVVDLVAYVLSWNFRVRQLTKPGRIELNGFLEQIKLLRYRTTRQIDLVKDYDIWSITVV